MNKTPHPVSVFQNKGLAKKYYAVMWRWHDDANQYHALGYSSNIIRTIISMGMLAVSSCCRAQLAHVMQMQNEENSSNNT